MKKEEILSKEEKKANVLIAYAYLFIACSLVFMVIFEILGIFILPKDKAIGASIPMIILACTPSVIIFGLKINEYWVKYVCLMGICMISALSYAIFTFHFNKLFLYRLHL